MPQYSLPLFRLVAISAEAAVRLPRRAASQVRNHPPSSLWLQSSQRALLALSIVVVMAGCGSKSSPEAEPVVTVQAVRVERSEIEQQVTAEAVLYPLYQATIVPKISAPVKKFYVNRGDHVRAGELLAVLENRDLAAAVAENKGSYEQAEANYENTAAANLPEQIRTAELDVTSAKAAYDSAQQVYESSKKLYQEGAMAKKQLDQAQVAATQAQNQLQMAEQHLAKLQSVGEKAQLKAAQGQLAAARGRYENAQAQLSYSEIRSPIDGVVTDRPLYEGEMATAGTPLMTLMNLSQVIARAHVPESEAALLKVGDPAEITAPGQTKPVPGKVTVVSPALDPQSTTVQVWIQARNPGEQLKPGTTVSVTAIAKKVPDALVIPQSALLSDSDQGTSVMVIGSDNLAHQTRIQTGIEQDGRVQITEGLKAGELVVGQGAYGLPDGTKVKY
jgi:HlyD family secretion protein